MADDKKKKDAGAKDAAAAPGAGAKKDKPKVELTAEQQAKRDARAAGGKKGGKKGGGDENQGPSTPRVPARLRIQFQKQFAEQLKKDLGLTNPMEVPRLVKITVNMGLGEAVSNPKIIDSAVEELRAITGQQPVVTKSKKSIATFKLRENQKIGAMVTLRRDTMYEFFDRLVTIALPRVRDFKGVPPKGFDGRGNYTLGVREQIIFPEINFDQVDKIKGMNITIVTTAKTDDQGRALLRTLGMPFRSL